MNLIITRDTLTDIASRAKSIVGTKHTSPVLGCAVLDATDEGIDATAMRIGMGFVGQYKANVSRRGKVAVPAEDLLMAVQSLPVGPISMDLADNGRLTLSVGKSKTTIGTYDPADHPGVSTVNPDARLTVVAPDLAKLLEQVKASMGADGHAQGLDGVHIDTSKPGVFRLATTDGNRLAWSECAYTGDAVRKPYLPRTGALELLAMVDGYAGGVSLSFDGARGMVAEIDGARLILSLSEGQFPVEYRQVLPTSYKRTVRFDRTEMLDTVTRLGKIGATELEVAIKSDVVALKARKRDGGVKEGNAEVTADLTGEPITIGMSPSILLDALKSCTGETVTLSLGDALSPISLVNPDDKAAQFIIMPMRLS